VGGAKRVQGADNCRYRCGGVQGPRGVLFISQGKSFKGKTTWGRNVALQSEEYIRCGRERGGDGGVWGHDFGFKSRVGGRGNGRFYLS